MRETPDKPKLSVEDVRHVARLARLSLDEERLARFTPQLESILDYVAKIGQADVGGVPPMAKRAAAGERAARGRGYRVAVD